MEKRIGSIDEKGFWHGALTQKTVWTKSSDGGKYHMHRIPGIVVTKKGPVIIYCEARTDDISHSCGAWLDWALMDVYIQRSKDGGDTFGEPIYICRGDDKTACINNPVIIVGNDNILHILYCKDYSIRGGGIWYRRSDDDGLTWTEEKQLTGYTDIEHDCFAFGPTHGICTKEGILMVPVWFVPKGAGRDGDFAHGPAKVSVFYSKDNGETWLMDAPASQRGGEYDIAQLPDGSIAMNGRAKPYRNMIYSPTGFGEWTENYFHPELRDPSCCGGMITVEPEGYAPCLLVAHCDAEEKRENVVVHCSFDNGKTFSKVLKLSGRAAGGYVDLYADANGCVYVLYEILRAGVHMRLARFSLIDEFYQ